MVVYGLGLRFRAPGNRRREIDVKGLIGKGRGKAAHLYWLLGDGIEVDEGCMSPFIKRAVVQMERFEYESGGQM
jgi:hypothetical protein